MYVPIRSPKHPVLMPIRLPNAQNIAHCFQWRQIDGFVRGIGQYNENVNDGLSRKSGDGRRPNMLDAQDRITNGASDDPGVFFKLARPLVVVIDDPKIAFLDAADKRGFARFSSHSALRSAYCRFVETDAKELHKRVAREIPKQPVAAIWAMVEATAA